jgi:hypothetical protein
MKRLSASAAWPATCYTPVFGQDNNRTTPARLDENGLVECMSTTGTSCTFYTPSACATALAAPLDTHLRLKCTLAAMQTFPGWCYSAAVHLGAAIGTGVLHRYIGRCRVAFC